MTFRSGGAPPLTVGKPNVGDRAVFDALMDSVWASGQLTNDGPLVRQFEGRLCELLGVRNAVCVANATLGLELALGSLGLREGGEVIVPSFTFVATAHAVSRAGFRVRFADVGGPRSHHVTAASVEAAMTDDTVAIVPVHLWGVACEARALEALARRRGVALVFDAAHAFLCRAGSAGDGRMVGAFGDAEVFSFHATKFMTCGEGGAVTTNDDALAARLRLARNFGFDGYDRVGSVGTNAKMSELHAALGLTNLRGAAAVVMRNAANAHEYRRLLDGVPGLRLYAPPDELAHGERNFQYVVCEVDAVAFGLGRNAVVRLLEAEGVRARRYFHPGVHALEAYAGVCADAEAELPHTVALSRRVLVLPTGLAVDKREVELVCGLLRFMHEHAADIARLFAVL